jgi:3-methyladenine DNA glycosylase/8-oxoguanine DNA glycosylase
MKDKYTRNERRRSSPSIAAIETWGRMRRAQSWRGIRVYTIGHSTRSIDELVALLRTFGVSLLADIRTIPRSRHNPQFNGDALPSSLRRRGIRYVHLPRLGGLRRASKQSLNTGWRNASFRGFADYMMTEEFEAGLLELRALGKNATVALMCAEAVPWRCHRSLVADALVARGAHVEHIIGSTHTTPHRLTPFATVRDKRLTYPGADAATSRLATTAPFHLQATVRVLQRRPGNLVDVWEHDRYLRVFQAGDDLVLVEVENRGTIDRPDLRWSVRQGTPSGATKVALAQTLRTVLGLDLDVEPARRVAESDRRLRPTAQALRGMRPPRFPEIFEAFANVVPFQQLSLDAGVAIVSRLVERFGERLAHDGRGFYAFPKAKAIAGARIEALRACGLSLGKAESIRSLARLIESGELSAEKLAGMSTDDALETLVDLPGIGPWSAGLVLLRGLGRLDVFPSGDVGAERGLRTLLRAGARTSLKRIVARFGDRRGYLYFCALGGNLLARGLIHAAP